MFKRIIPAIKFIFTGEIELPENVQKSIKCMLDETIGTANVGKENLHDALSIGRFSNYITTYLSEQHWPQCHTDYIAQVGASHYKTLINIRRRDKYGDGLYYQIYGSREGSSVSRLDN